MKTKNAHTRERREKKHTEELSEPGKYSKETQKQEKCATESNKTRDNARFNKNMNATVADDCTRQNEMETMAKQQQNYMNKKTQHTETKVFMLCGIKVF